MMRGLARIERRAKFLRPTFRVLSRQTTALDASPEISGGLRD